MDKIVIEIPACTCIKEPVLQNMYKDAVERIATSVADEVASILGGLEEAVEIALKDLKKQVLKEGKIK